MSRKLKDVSVDLGSASICEYLNPLLRNGGLSIVRPIPVSNPVSPSEPDMSQQARDEVVRRVAQLLTDDSRMPEARREEIRDALGDMDYTDLQELQDLLEGELSTRVEVVRHFDVHVGTTPRVRALSPQEFTHTRRRI